MGKTEESSSADSFIDSNQEMPNSKIMMTHYSVEVFFSDKARNEFVEPILSQFPSTVVKIFNKFQLYAKEISLQANIKDVLFLVKDFR
jgi:hypothetical protein